MTNTWILVCDAAKARLFETSGRRGDWTEVACYANPELRAPPAERTTGRTIPRAQESVGAARHIIEPRMTRKDRSAQAFARHIAEPLREAKAHGRYDRLFLVAPPRFLGVLREEIGDPEAASVAGTLDDDVVALSKGDLIQHMCRAFPHDFATEKTSGARI